METVVQLETYHRMDQVGGVLEDHLVPTLLREQGCQPVNQVAQYLIQPDTE